MYRVVNEKNGKCLIDENGIKSAIFKDIFEVENSGIKTYFGIPFLGTEPIDITYESEIFSERLSGKEVKFDDISKEFILLF